MPSLVAITAAPDGCNITVSLQLLELSFDEYRHRGKYSARMTLAVLF